MMLMHIMRMMTVVFCSGICPARPDYRKGKYGSKCCPQVFHIHDHTSFLYCSVLSADHSTCRTGLSFITGRAATDTCFKTELNGIPG